MKVTAVNRDYLGSRLVAIRRSLARLELLRAGARAEVLEDPDQYAIAEHHLRRLLECALDVARHLLAKDGSFRPANYPEMMDGLERLQAIPPALARDLRELAEQRNRLVHLGTEVTPEELWALIAAPIDCLHTYCARIEEILIPKDM